ncbi:MAG: hypothetical protein PW845_06015 [Pseudomonas sp.]|uniref:hypothetical protein n=1 Tax=Pseudomonas abieticivorans TaxID=2931382 RepID=UPI0020C0D8E6|nr:hypothetical protein [Pseudomonas sp. PIA16]MDE1164943.1 hypothetical protein [Pseudomonas sp.]
MDVATKPPAKAAARFVLIALVGAGGCVLLAYLPFSPLHSLATFIMVATVMGYGLNKWSRLANRASKNNQQRGIATTQR